MADLVVTKVNNELKNFGARNDPVVALLAITVGSIIVVPPLVSSYRTAARIRDALASQGADARPA